MGCASRRATRTARSSPRHRERPHTAKTRNLRGNPVGSPSGSGPVTSGLRDSEVAMADYGTLLRDHVTLKVRSIDRIFLQAYVPGLQSVGQVCTFLRWQRGFRIPSSAVFGKIGEQYVDEIGRFAERSRIPM